MRVQHNIMAMNSYRNYNNNSSQINRNIEKLSSGYKINRAGDDAAGLAISEKMRAQIVGLEGAQKNAKSGINLVQTAESALTEVHSMLDRMYDLAEQSANGTYDEKTDRRQLQKEIEQLSKEIDRIADSANFNGQKLLDGSMSATGATSSSATSVDVSKIGIDIKSSAEEIAAVKGVYSANAKKSSGALETGGKVELKLEYELDGQTVSKTINLTTGGTDNKTLFVDTGDGQKAEVKVAGVTLKNANTIDFAKSEDLSLINKALQMDEVGLNDLFKITGDTDGKLTFTALEGGSSGAKLTGFEYNVVKADGTKTVEKSGVSTDTIAADANKAYDLSKATIWDISKLDSLEDSIFEINGEKFAFVQADKVDDLTSLQKEALESAGVKNNVVYVGKSATAIAQANVITMSGTIHAATGLDVQVGKFDATTKLWRAAVTSGASADTDATKIKLSSSTTSSNSGAGGLTLQIGDTADEWNQLHVEIDDIHVKALKINTIDISKQGGAQKAMNLIQDAINTVSDIRGTLGATQNRLEHTINNLSVMQENMQDAESVIRDTDVADEMMKYTKNSILVQSAQAMLAQANQQPQGVLQLLQ